MAIVYVVEDDPSIQEVELIALKNSNYVVQTFDCASAFYKRLENLLPDLVLLDIMLPDEDGYQIIRKLRGDTRTKKIPVIMVTARTSELDMVKGLDYGADDYIKKPFSVMELLSRVRALLRRSQDGEIQEYTVGGIHLDIGPHTVLAGGEPINLTLKEFELLEYLMHHEGTVLSRDVLLRDVWGMYFEGETRTVDVHIKKIRQKLGIYGNQIKTCRGVGYSISPNMEEET